MGNALQFAGRELDNETGLYFNRARYYDPLVGRFISEDPIGLVGGTNLYAYAGNDPINHNDPSGLAYQCREVMLSPDRTTVENGVVVVRPGQYVTICTDDFKAWDYPGQGSQNRQGRPRPSKAKRLERLAELGKSYCSAAKELKAAVYSGATVDFAIGWGLTVSVGAYATPSNYGFYMRGGVMFGFDGSIGAEFGGAVGGLAGPSLGASAGAATTSYAGAVGWKSLSGAVIYGGGVPVSFGVNGAFTWAPVAGGC